MGGVCRLAAGPSSTPPQKNLLARDACKLVGLGGTASGFGRPSGVEHPQSESVLGSVPSLVHNEHVYVLVCVLVCCSSLISVLTTEQLQGFPSNFKDFKDLGNRAQW